MSAVWCLSGCPTRLSLVTTDTIKIESMRRRQSGSERQKNVVTEAELGQILDNYAAAEDMAGALMLVERPDRWYDDPHWRCVNGHVSDCPVAGYTPDNVYSYQLCPGCKSPVRLTFPEDVSGPLKPAPEVM